MHSRYEKWCVLSFAGQLDPADEAAFVEHVNGCSNCRETLRELGQLNRLVMPMLAAQNAERQDIDVPANIRERFLERLGSPDLAKLEATPVFRNISTERTDQRASWSRDIFAFRIVATAAACLVFSFAGYLIGRSQFTRRATTQVHIATENHIATPTPQAPTMTFTVPRTADTEKEVSEIKQQLTAAETKIRDLEDKLQALTSQVDTQSAQSQQRIQAKIKELQDSEDQAAKLRSQLASLQQKLVQTDAIQMAQQQMTQDLIAKLNDAQRQLDRERDEHFARSQAAQMISARNLHIVDVRESEPGGKQQRAFGRVFYVEGQSLVFYAYDLPTPKRSDRHVVFQVWGETAGVKAASYNLGILHSDVPDHSRWVLTFDDPKILNRINSVYITADQDGNVRREPAGRKLLYAFLGSPNHP